MNKLIAALTILVLMTGAAAAQPEITKSPFNPFSTVETFVENAEVQLAGIIGGQDLKAKALANNAEESLQEAERLAERNRSMAAAQKIEKYERNLNRSQKLLDEGENTELRNQVRNISNQNVQRLKEVKKKVPAEARKGIENAINNIKKRNRPAPEEKPGNNTDKPERPSQSAPANRTGKPGEAVENNISKPERNQTGAGKGKEQNGTGSTKDRTNDTSESVENPVENNGSRPPLSR